MPDIKNIHIGERIAEKLEERKLNYAEFARRINVDRTTVYNILRSKSIDIERLMLISEVLEYDFLKEVYMGECSKETTIQIVVPKSKLADIKKITSMKIIIEAESNDDD